MVKRRTLGEGLTPEQEAFLNPVEVAPKQKPKTEQKPTTRKEKTPMARTALKQEPAHQPSFQAASATFNPQVSVPGTMSLNTRIPAEISNALLTAAMQRKIQRQSRATQQDIVAEALQAWLQQNGFLVKFD